MGTLFLPIETQFIRQWQANARCSRFHRQAQPKFDTDEYVPFSIIPSFRYLTLINDDLIALHNAKVLYGGVLWCRTQHQEIQNFLSTTRNPSNIVELKREMRAWFCHGNYQSNSPFVCLIQECETDRKKVHCWMKWTFKCRWRFLNWDNRWCTSWAVCVWFCLCLMCTKWWANLIQK